MPKLSVLMSAYNSERYLRDSIDSILGQDLLDFEFLIIDDGSTDGTPGILNTYQEQDKRVRIITNKVNIGLSKSLNIGIMQAKGEYIARQDADDISMPGRLSVQMGFMKRHPDVSLSGTFYIMVDEIGKALYRSRLPTRDQEIKNWLKRVNCFCHGSVMFRKRDVEECGFYPEQYACSQDYALWLEMSERFRLSNISEFLYLLRLHKNARSVKDKTLQWECAFKIKKDKSLIVNESSLSNKFISGEFFRYGSFFNNMGMKKMALKYFIKGMLFRAFTPSVSVRADKLLGVCMVTGSFYPEITGGGLQCKTLIDSLKDKNIRFFVFTTTQQDLPARTIAYPDIIRIKLKNLKLASKVKAFFYIIVMFLRINNKFSVLHLHGFSQKTILFIILGKLFRKHIILKMTSLGEDDVDSLLRSRHGKAKVFFFSLADIFISVTPAITDIFLRSDRFKNRRIITIPNGVDTERFRPPKGEDEKIALRKELFLPQDAFIILFVGFFAEYKGPHIFWQAYKNIAEKNNSNMKALFVGSSDIDKSYVDAKLVKDIKEDIKAAKMEDNVIFVEKTMEIEKYYRASDVFVLPSLREGLPNALLEAMSTGIGCVFSDLEGVTGYLISDREGFVFKKGNVGSLSDILAELMNNKRMIAESGRNAKSKIMRDFSIERIAEQYYEIYNTIDR